MSVVRIQGCGSGHGFSRAGVGMDSVVRAWVGMDSGARGRGRGRGFGCAGVGEAP